MQLSMAQPTLELIDSKECGRRSHIVSTHSSPNSRLTRALSFCNSVQRMELLDKKIHNTTWLQMALMNYAMRRAPTPTNVFTPMQTTKNAEKIATS